ncbi:lytic polysaccharide monooxygenase [Streptomyces sp. NPDC050504]|uniref:lytic polysaccharide monooxygenase auxiliary activity family 9 protein n=1 Tax=Streptomyces sp. NPDC050504 TaxID=3365618 RepID=UPI0037A09582
MAARRHVARLAPLTAVPFALGVLTAPPAAAHGTMTDPVSRVSACFAEGPESPDSPACRAAVAVGGTQPLYDWNEVNIGDVAGAHKARIPDGKLCSAGRAKYRGLDLPRTDWPSSKLAAGKHTFRYRATAPHRGTFSLYVTKDGYDPSKPLKWSDLEEQPFAEATNPRLESGAYVIEGTVPAKSGRHLVYSIWQRSDSPEAFYTCSDVVFGKDTGGAAGAPAAAAPSDEEIAAGAGKSTVDHQGHGGDAPAEHGAGHGTQVAAAVPVPAPGAKGGAEHLAATGGDSDTAYYAVGGVAALAAGGGLMFVTVRRRRSEA